MRVRASTVTVLRVFWCKYGSLGLRLSRLSSFAEVPVGCRNITELCPESLPASGITLGFRANRSGFD